MSLSIRPHKSLTADARRHGLSTSGGAQEDSLEDEEEEVSKPLCSASPRPARHRRRCATTCCFMAMFKAGPEVSLRGSPTVSPCTDASRASLATLTPDKVPAMRGAPMTRAPRDAEHRGGLLPSEAVVRHVYQNGGNVEHRPHRLLEALELQSADVPRALRLDGCVVSPEGAQARDAPNVDKVRQRAQRHGTKTEGPPKRNWNK